MFLPWTQNVNAKGYVTTRYPEQRPQSVQSVIAGRIESWYVKEGDYVEQGDTIIYISEVKSEYFDPDLLDRTAEQLSAKGQSVEAYQEKIDALDRQFSALEQGLVLKRDQIRNKIDQATNKVSIDSIDLVAGRVNLDIAINQLERTQQLFDKGLKTLSELQEKENKAQSSKAKVEVLERKLTNQRTGLVQLQIELLAVEQEYGDKLNKSRSERQSAVSAMLESMAATSKLQNQWSTYNQRQQFYYVTAPQDGYITQTLKKGLGETIKEGASIATIMPKSIDLALELYLKPQDIPLLENGDLATLRFDGWPAIIITGWPQASTGVFRGEIVAIDRFISENGLYRILISPDLDDRDWPGKLRVGTGASAFILLGEVPVWYEIWRQLNGFPPDFYKEKDAGEDLKTKAPLKSVK
jgi:adhesin transport system membrane fusion protein